MEPLREIDALGETRKVETMRDSKPGNFLLHLPLLQLLVVPTAARQELDAMEMVHAVSDDDV